MEDLNKRRLRETTVRRLGRTGGTLQIVNSGKGYAIYSPLDLTSGLLGTETAGILGYEPAYAQALVKNTSSGAFTNVPRSCRAPWST